MKKEYVWLSDVDLDSDAFDAILAGDRRDPPDEGEFLSGIETWIERLVD